MLLLMELNVLLVNSPSSDIDISRQAQQLSY